MRAWLYIAIANLLPHFSAMLGLRAMFLRLAGIQIGARACIMGPLDIRPRTAAKGISIGEGVFINSSVRMAAQGGITLSDSVMIGPNVSLETVDHSLLYVVGKGREDIVRPIIIDREVWIGAGAIILPGITIGQGSVVAAGAVVTRDVPPMTLVGGVPARYIKSFS